MRIADLIAAIERDGRAAVVLVAEARGSAPREAGAAMLVTSADTRGTVGGGTVEHAAISEARRMLADAACPLPNGGRGPSGAAADPRGMNPPPTGGRAGRGFTRDYPLGPALDQCCGGHMRLAYAVFGEADLPALSKATGRLALWPEGPEFAEPPAPPAVLIYGAGHVGTALVRALAPLPFSVRWIDARLDVFPGDPPPGVETVATPLPEAEARAAPGDALHVVLTHSHALDMEIVGAVLERGEFGYLGLIGSGTKKALFLKKLRARGIPEDRLAQLVCPIGVPGVKDKRPAVIAASVAAQLLQVACARASQELRATA